MRRYFTILFIMTNMVSLVTGKVLPCTVRHCTETYISSSGRNCTYCPPGTHKHMDCTESDSRSICIGCPEDHFQAHCNRADSCEPCRHACGPYLEKAVDCSLYADIVCACEQGRFWLNETKSDGVCLPHNLCPQGYGFVSHGTPWRDTECEPCIPEKTFSSHRGHTPCLPCRSCDIYRVNCTVVQDAECGTITSTSNPSGNDGNKGGVSNHTGVVIGVAVSVSVVVIAIIIVLIVLYRRRRGRVLRRSNNSIAMRNGGAVGRDAIDQHNDEDNEQGADIADDEEHANNAHDEEHANIAHDEEHANIAHDEEHANIAHDEEHANIAHDEEHANIAHDEEHANNAVGYDDQQDIEAGIGGRHEDDRLSQSEGANTRPTDDTMLQVEETFVHATPLIFDTKINDSFPGETRERYNHEFIAEELSKDGSISEKETSNKADSDDESRDFSNLHAQETRRKLGPNVVEYSIDTPAMKTEYVLKVRGPSIRLHAMESGESPTNSEPRMRDLKSPSYEVDIDIPINIPVEVGTRMEESEQMNYESCRL